MPSGMRADYCLPRLSVRGATVILFDLSQAGAVAY
jgi:hypothetical protein